MSVCRWCRPISTSVIFSSFSLSRISGLPVVDSFPYRWQSIWEFSLNLDLPAEILEWTAGFEWFDLRSGNSSLLPAFDSKHRLLGTRHCMVQLFRDHWKAKATEWSAASEISLPNLPGWYSSLLPEHHHHRKLSTKPLHSPPHQGARADKTIGTIRWSTPDNVIQRRARHHT